MCARSARKFFSVPRQPLEPLVPRFFFVLICAFSSLTSPVATPAARGAGSPAHRLSERTVLAAEEDRAATGVWLSTHHQGLALIF